jgi:hypothetical protein
MRSVRAVFEAGRRRRPSIGAAPRIDRQLYFPPVTPGVKRAPTGNFSSSP